jgi:hypothetical protein
MKTNDFDVVVRQVSNGHSSQYAKGGLMVRETLDPGSRNWIIINDPSSADGIMAPDNSGMGANLVECNTRDLTGGTTAAWDQLTPRTNNAAYPNAWVRLKRTGNVMDGYLSSNGSDWTHVASYNTSTNTQGVLVNPVYVGICTTAHNNDGLNVPPYLYYNTAEYADYTSSFIPTARAHLTVGLSGANVIVSWTPTGGHLESSPAISGAGVNWQPVGSSNPASIPLGAGSQFFRVVNP